MKTANKAALDSVYDRLGVAVSVLPVVCAGVVNDEEPVRLWNTMGFVMPEIRRQVRKLDGASTGCGIDAQRALSVLECVRHTFDCDEAEIDKAHVASALLTAHEIFRDVLHRLDRFLSSMPEARKEAAEVLQGGGPMKARTVTTNTGDKTPPASNIVPFHRAEDATKGQ